MDDQPHFLFASCQRGAEAALKSEVTERIPGARLAFSRPGFVTFKLPLELEPDPSFHGPWVFARTHGHSLGKVAGHSLRQLAAETWSLVAQVPPRPIQDLHVWQCDADLPGQHGFEPGQTPLAEEVERALREAAPADSSLRAGARNSASPTPRNLGVIDVVLVSPSEWWIGWHRVSTPEQRWPGGVIPITRPAHATSRAYLKIEEVLRWSSFPLTDGDEWVEIGCAPGGACQALLDRGQFITGIDPAEVDASLLAHERFRHLQMRSADVRRREFRDVDWLAADMNVAPNYTLDAVEAIVLHPGVTIRGLVLTLKLTEWNLADSLPDYLARIRGWGFRDVRARQFAYNGREVGVVALRRRALRRIHRASRQRRPATRG